MNRVMFATICDKDGCKRRSDEHSAFPSCRVCLEDVFPEHDVEGERDDETGTTLCRECKEAENA